MWKILCKNIFIADINVISDDNNGSENLENNSSILEAGNTYEVPLLPIENVVLCPGMVFPHRLLSPTDRRAVVHALESNIPLKRMIGVISYHEHFMAISLESIGCLAQIVGISNDEVNILTVGRQRFRIQQRSLQNANLCRVSVEILHDTPPMPLPSIVAEGGGALSPWVYRSIDARSLSHQVQILLRDRIPSVIIPEACINDPLKFSFWLTSNLPVDNIRRQQLLDAHDAVTRLSLAIDYFNMGSELHCIQCLRPISHVSSTGMLGHLANIGLDIENNDSFGGIFVNSHAVVHDILLTTSADTIVVGEPDPNNSWFQGFGWQIVYCSGCSAHVGWRFTRVNTQGMESRMNLSSNDDAVDSSRSSAHTGDDSMNDSFLREDDDAEAFPGQFSTLIRPSMIRQVATEPRESTSTGSHDEYESSEDFVVPLSESLASPNDIPEEGGFYGLRRAALTLETENAPALLFGGMTPMFIGPGGTISRASTDEDSGNEILDDDYNDSEGDLTRMS